MSCFITQWGSLGSAPGEFNSPTGIALGNDANIYITDYFNYRVQVFTSSGAFVTQWGSQGTGPGQFSAPSDLAIDPSGNVYVADYVNHCIQKFSNSGGFIGRWGTQGSGPGRGGQREQPHPGVWSGTDAHQHLKLGQRQDPLPLVPGVERDAGS